MQIGSRTYDVEFLFNSAFNLYPLQRFDFDTFGEAQIAVSAIVNVLNADGGVLTVGESAAEADVYENFDIPYEAFERVFDPPGEIFKPVKITFLRLAEAYTGDANQPGVWVEGGVVDGGTLFASDLYAKFTMVGEGGSGNLPPVADAGGPTYSGVVGEPVNFDGRGSTDSDGVIVDRNWFFGDGATSDGETASHTYQEPGAHNITYEVIDDRGASDTDSATAFIGASSHPPTADADGPYSGAVDAAIIFDGSGSTDRDNDIVDYDWRFGDDTSGSGKNPSHSYSKAGHYSVSLTVTDRTGDTDTDSTNAFVGIGDLPPEADAGGPYVGFMGVAKTFDGTGSRAAPGGSIETYAWDFGDGGTGSGPTPIYTYNMAGSHTVTLTVTDDSGKTDSGAATVFIGDGEPNPDDRLIDVVTLGNVGGGDEADLAVLDAVMANGDQLSSRIHVRDGGTGEEIYQVDLTGSVQSVALETVTGGAGPLLAVLQRKDNGNMQVVFLNANDGTAAGSVQYFDETWTPIDILAVRDAGRSRDRWYWRAGGKTDDRSAGD